MPKRANVWRKRRRDLKKAAASFGGGAPEGLHDVRVALRRIGATAGALGEKRTKKLAGSLVRSLSERRQLEVDRELLARVREVGVLSPDVAAGLDAQWDRLFTTGAHDAEKVVSSRDFRQLVRRLGDLASDNPAGLARHLQRARRSADREVARPPDGRSDKEIHRYRLAVKRARYLAEDLLLLGAADPAPALPRLKAAQEALGRWNDVRLFRKRLERTRAEAEKRGAVTLALELDRLLLALDRTIEKLRADALEASRPSNLVALRRTASAAPAH